MSAPKESYTIAIEKSLYDQMRQEAKEQGVTLRNLIIRGRLLELENSSSPPRPQTVPPAIASLSADINAVLAVVAWLRRYQARIDERDSVIREVCRNLGGHASRPSQLRSDMATALTSLEAVRVALGKHEDGIGPVIEKLEPSLHALAADLRAIRQRLEVSGEGADQPTSRPQ